MTRMGPAAEAQHFAVIPVWNRPKTTTSWRQISLTKVRKFKMASKKARKQAREAKVGVSAVQAEVEVLRMENLCLQFKSLKL